MNRWTQETFRRYSVDIHVPDWHPDLLKNFDAERYVECIKRGGAQSLLHYTKSHVGLSLWRTRLGKMHANMGEHDWFGEVVAACRRRGMHPLAYFSLIYDNWAYETHADWRFLPAEGEDRVLNSRYGRVCPNSGYRDYVLSCVREIASSYDIDGMFFDMTFWPGAPCYCGHCTARFHREHAADAPRVIQWNDPVWRAFQRAREQWLLEFAQACTDAARQARPGITVNHQFSTVIHPWTLGVPLELRAACDYVGGDFYGGPAQHSLACKMYDSLTLNHPFEFHTSRTRTFTDHVTVKPMEELRVESYIATLHSAALMLVDYINADGSLNSEVYDFLGEISRQRAAYEPFLGGRLLADLAVYFDKNSLYDPARNGESVTRPGGAGPHLDAVTGIARILQEAHLPFGVVTNVTLDQLGRYRGVVLPNVLELTPEQACVFRAFVREGGILYASGPPAHLEDVLGVRQDGRMGTSITYLTPSDAALAQALWPQDHLSYAGPMVHAQAADGVQVLATVTLPFVEPELGKVIGSRFAAIHSNPPALIAGTSPAIVLHTFGRGSALWTAAPFETSQEKVNACLVLNLLRRALLPPFAFEVDSHPAVEMTLFDQAEKGRLLAGLLNLQQKLPQIPVPAAVRVRNPAGKRIHSVKSVPGGEAVGFQRMGSGIEFRVPPFDALVMFTLEYE